MIKGYDSIRFLNCYFKKRMSSINIIMQGSCIYCKKKTSYLFNNSNLWMTN